MNARVPAEVFPPGEFLREELEARDWSQQELADILDRPPRLASEPSRRKRPKVSGRPLARRRNIG